MPFVCVNAGLSYSSAQSVDAALAIGVVPCLALFISYVLLNEKVDVKNFIGIILGLFSVSMLLYDKSIAPSNSLYILLSASFFYALATVYGKYLTTTKKISHVDISLYCPLIAFLVLSAGSLYQYDEIIYFTKEGLPLRVIGAAAVLGILHTTISSFIVYYLLKTRGVVFTSYSNYAIPSLGAVWGFLAFNEVLNMNQFISLALIITGLMFIHRIQNGNGKLEKR